MSSMTTFRVAIVGAGPAGYFAAQALQNLATEDRDFAIDMIERLPTPWGLVRSGVAPDHPKIKTVSKVFEKVANAGNFRLFGNVELGTDITTAELIDRYDAVVIATGSSLGRKLEIPGEGLFGSLSAADFVPWYNGHPDFKDLHFPVDCDTAVVIGAGNVAMDVARMLALEPAELDTTDTADHAIDVLRKSAIRKVILCARRGPEHAAFTAPELRELPKLEHTNVIMDKDEIAAALARVGENPEKDVKSNLSAMELIANSEPKSHDRTLEFQFFLAPQEIRGDGQVEEIVLGINKIVDDKVLPTGETKTIKCGLVISAIGYVASSIEGIPYANGKVVNNEGRINGSNMYVVGWAKRGPSGVIGTNKSDASDVMKLLVEDLSSAPKNKGDVLELLIDHEIVTQSRWELINDAEVAKGEPLGKPRVKAVDKQELLRLGGL
ncbi:MAG: FAD-dependent oxidoreductase [Candidatus Nanopelagicaceae bacterium]|nr:FAD-dependent oxidoreductase [Candidatus Nanopelagicaceae bacterium]